MILFYSGCEEFAQILHWVAKLCPALGMSLTLCPLTKSSQGNAKDENYETFVRQHQLSVVFKDKTASEVLDGEVNKPDSQLGTMSLLVFGRSFGKGFWFQKRRRLVERLIRKSHHSILLCP